MKTIPEMKRISTIALLALAAVVMAVAAALANNQTANSQTPRDTPPSGRVASADSTVIRVYVLSRGGKFVGDDIGGARVTLRDARTGEFLASGQTRGGAGPDDLMTGERARTEPLSLEGGAVFTATMALDGPRLVEFEAYGPLGAQGAANRVTATEWVLPGSFAKNDIVLEIPGLIVQVLNPPTHFLPATKPHLQVPLRVNVTMMCGCPIGPGLPWKPQNYTVQAMVIKPDETHDMVDLHFDENAPDNAPSQFIGTYTAMQSGVYQVIVMARQIGEDNSGSDHITFIIP